MRLPKGGKLPDGARITGTVNLAALGIEAATSHTEKSGQEAHYGNTKTVAADGVACDSKREAERWALLKALERAGFIADLEPHPEYEIAFNGVKICTYTADSRYRIVQGDRAGEAVIEDVKSEPTRKKYAYRLKVRMMEALGHKVTEVCEVSG